MSTNINYQRKTLLKYYQSIIPPSLTIRCVRFIFYTVRFISPLIQKQKLQRLYKERDNVKVEQILQRLTECAEEANGENLLDLAVQV